MSIQQIKDLFPLKARVTQEILDSADVRNLQYCNGALTLKSVLPDELKPLVTWGVHHGGITVQGHRINVSTVEKYDMWDILKPTDVTFTLDF